MAAVRADIARWFDHGVNRRFAYMIVVCDGFDYEDYPVYANTPAEARKAHAAHDGKNMQTVMEVYDLSADRDSQLNERRAMHLPPREEGQNEP